MTASKDTIESMTVRKDAIESATPSKDGFKKAGRLRRTNAFKMVWVCAVKADNFKTV